MSNYLTIPRNYHDNDILFAADLDDICQAIMDFLNNTKLNEDNLSTSITDLFVAPGFITLFGSDTAPTGWLNCDGSVISQTDYADLYAVVGDVFNTGGEGAGNFRLPDYRRRAPVGKGGTGTGIVVLGNALGNYGGEETHTLAADKSTLPAHYHGDTTGHKHNEVAYVDFTGSFLELRAFDYGGGDINVAETTGTTSGLTYNNTGGGGAHNNMQPSMVMNFIIKV